MFRRINYSLGKTTFSAVQNASRCVGTENSGSNLEIILPDNLERIDSHKFCVGHVKRRSIFALRAFNVELSLVRDSTTNSDRAKVRFHFWSQLVEEIIRRNDGGDPNLEKQTAYFNYTPVAKELLEIFFLIDLEEGDKTRLRDLIGARVSSRVLGYKPFADMAELELYCSKSNSSLYQLGWMMGRQVHNIWQDNYQIVPTLRSLSDSLGVAHGLSNIIRGIPYNSTKNCCYIPTDLLKINQLTSKDFMGKNLDGERISPVVRALALRCQSFLDEAFQCNRFIPTYFRHLFLPRVAIQSNLNRLKKCNYNICHTSLQKPNGLLPLSLWMNSKFHRSPIL